jgi:hypothetical protein
MSRTRTVTVRLDDLELMELRKLPGENDAARLRTLLHAKGAQSGFAAEVAATVRQAVTVAVAMDGDRTRKVLLELAKQLNQILQPGSAG